WPKIPCVRNRSSLRRVRHTRYLKLVEQHRPGDESLGSHSCIKIKPDILRAAVRSRNGESERDGSPARHHSDDHRTFLNNWSTCTYDPPFQSPWAKELAFVLTFKFVRPRGQHDELPDAVVLDPTISKIH